jgi:hypothetical protein
MATTKKPANSRSTATASSPTPRKSTRNPRKAGANAPPSSSPSSTGQSEHEGLTGQLPHLPSANAFATAENLLSGLANLAPGRVTNQLKTMAERMMNWAGTAAEVAVSATAPLIKEPTRRAAMEKAGAVLRDARETAGLTAHDVAAALDFSDTNLLDLAESGRIALPFDVILRLAALLARNDPLPFVMNLTRIYNPGLWKIIEQLGIGKLALHVGREREFINIYRSRDDARHLSDAEYKLVLEFTEAAFSMAVNLTLQKRPAATKAKT